VCETIFIAAENIAIRKTGAKFYNRWLSL